MTMSTRVAGVDWAGDCWLCVMFDTGTYDRTIVAPTFPDLWDTVGSHPEPPARLFVDIPIGLFDAADAETAERGRDCDRLARAVLESRRSSVFTPPARQAAYDAADGTPHADVSARNRDIVGKGLSIQAYHIALGIVEVDRFLRVEDVAERNRRREAVAEAHPEVCFAAFAGSPLEYSKTTAAGVGERLTALESVCPEPATVLNQVCTAVRDAATDCEIEGVTVDDVLDAIVLAAAASAPEADCQSLPTDPPTDCHGLPMAIHYRAFEPFALE